MLQDLRYAARSLRNNPGFTLVAALLIALGIGANCVIFSALNAVMLKKLAAHEPERLFRVVTNQPQIGRRSYMTQPFYQALRDKATLVREAFGEQEEFAALTDPGPAEQVRVREVTPNFFSALGVRALYGRVLAPGDTDAAVISYAFFLRRFSHDAVGRWITVGGRRYTIVGVLPRDFNGIAMDTGPEIRVPARDSEAKESDPKGSGAKSQIELSVRLRDGVSAQAAADEINSIRRAVEPEDTLALELEPLEHGISRFRERFSSALWFLVAAVAVLLLLVCTNVAGLLLARAAARRQEIAVRLALGATRSRLIRQMLTENLLLAAIGGAGGLAFAFAVTPLVQRAIPAQRDFAAEITPSTLDLYLDWRVLAFSLLLCFGTAILFGLAPACSASRSALHEALRAARSSAGWRGRQALMIFQVALCTVLLGAAGLLIRTFEKLDHLDAGFDRDHVVTFTVNPELAGNTAEQAESIKRAWIEQVRAMPGVESVAIALLGLMRGSGMKMSAGIEGQRITPAEFMNTSMNLVSPEYFETMGIRLLAGRTFTPADATRTPAAVIVNQAFVRNFFPDGRALGERVGGGGRGQVVKANAQIVGVVSDAKYRSLREPVPPVEYSFGSQASKARFMLHVRTANRPESIIAPVRDALRALDPAMPIIEIHTLAEEVETSLWSERLVAQLASTFGSLAAILTAVGLYGLIAYAVAQRTREIGIRIALGARSADISRAVGMPALTMVIAGVLAGLGASLLLAPGIRALLYETSPNDSVSLLLSGVFLILIAAGAVCVPILRALRIDPAIALRIDT